MVKIPEHLGDIFVVDPEEVCGALLLELVIGGDLDGGARLQLHLLPPVILHQQKLVLSTLYRICRPAPPKIRRHYNRILHIFQYRYVINQPGLRIRMDPH